MNNGGSILHGKGTLCIILVQSSHGKHLYIMHSNNNTSQKSFSPSKEQNYRILTESYQINPQNTAHWILFKIGGEVCDLMA